MSELAVINSTHPRSLSTVVEYDDADGPENRNSTVVKVRVLDSDGMEVTGECRCAFSTHSVRRYSYYFTVQHCKYAIKHYVFASDTNCRS